VVGHLDDADDLVVGGEPPRVAVDVTRQAIHLL
jgi:hypothetical protein